MYMMPNYIARENFHSADLTQLSVFAEQEKMAYNFWTVSTEI